MKEIISILLFSFLINLSQMADIEKSLSRSQPLLLTSNEKIEDLQKKIILNVEELLQQLTLNNQQQPKKIIIYEIETPLQKRGLLSYLRANQKKFQNLFKTFTNINKSATLPYFQDNLDISNFQKLIKEFKQSTHSLSELPFAKSHTLSLSSASSTIEKIIATFTDLTEIDKLLQNDINLLESHNLNYYIFINFKYEPFASNFALKELIQEEQSAKYKFVDASQQYEYQIQLEDDEHRSTKRQIESLIETQSGATETEAIGIPGYVFSGYLLGLLGLATTLIAVVALYEIKTPTKFARQNLNFGKEY